MSIPQRNLASFGLFRQSGGLGGVVQPPPPPPSPPVAYLELLVKKLRSIHNEPPGELAVKTRKNGRKAAAERFVLGLLLTGLVALGAGFWLRGVLDGNQDRNGEPDASGAIEPLRDGPGATEMPVAASQPETTNPVSRPSPIVFEPPVMDLGVLAPHEKVTATVQVRNPTNAPLKILDSRASCTCTAISLANTVIPAGGSVPLEATLSAGGQLGPKNAAVRVLVEGYDVAQIDVISVVALAVRAEPAYLLANRLRTDIQNPRNARPEDFEDVNQGEVTVSSSDGLPFKILSSNGKPPSFLDFDPAHDAPRNTYLIAWDLSEYDPVTCANAQSERMPEWWIIETDHPKCPIFDIQVRHRCTVPKPIMPGQTWIITERRALIGQVSPGETVEVELPLARHPKAQGPNEKLLVATTQSNKFTVRLLRQTPWQDNKSTCTLAVTLSADHRGVFTDEVVVTSNSGATASLTIIGKVAEASSSDSM
jgi:hypothetical protein